MTTSPSNAAEHAALLEARDFVADEMAWRQADRKKPAGAAEAKRVLAQIDAALSDEGAEG